ncbi:MAG: GNAT family N-acetyltransferase [Gemmatimonadaceae bacterium]|nr:GNAT family N-acetyltransferase [Gemmatimonadaceae bacterium]
MDALVALARRLERAQAAQNDRLTRAAGGQSMPLGGGFAHCRGEGHPLNQALGLVAPVREDELAAVEAVLGAGGFPVVLEVSPAADASLWPLLAARGYRVHQFQQLLSRPLDSTTPQPPAVDVRPVPVDQADLFNRLVFAGFTDNDTWRESPSPFAMPLDVDGISAVMAFVDGEPVAGGVLGMVDGVALLSGDAVLPAARGRGLQKALIAARLHTARTAGCDIACASTAPSTASQRSFESCGFRVTYPKLEMARGGD